MGTRRRGAVPAVLLAIAAGACSPQQEAGGCRVEGPARQFGLSGEWRWNTPGAGAATLCLRQHSPASVDGYIRGPSGETEQITGAIAPTGSIFLAQYEARPAPIIIIGRRQTDTITVEWVGTSGAAASGRGSGTIGGGRMVRVRD